MQATVALATQPCRPNMGTISWSQCTHILGTCLHTDHCLKNSCEFPNDISFPSLIQKDKPTHICNYRSHAVDPSYERRTEVTARLQEGACTVISRSFPRSVDIVAWPVQRWFACRVKFPLGGKRRAGVSGYGVTGYGVPRCGKRGVWWKTGGLVENAKSGGKCGVGWKTRGLSTKHGVLLFFNKIWAFLTKMRGQNFVS